MLHIFQLYSKVLIQALALKKFGAQFKIPSTMFRFTKYISCGLTRVYFPTRYIHNIVGKRYIGEINNITKEELHMP